MNAANTEPTSVALAISVDPNATLYIANATVSQQFHYPAMSSPPYSEPAAIAVNGTLMLGQDKSGGISGPVQIGNALAQLSTDGWVGLLCNNGGTIKDVTLDGGQSTVIIQGQVQADIYLSGACQVYLSGFPAMGIPRTGWNQGPSDPGCPMIDPANQIYHDGAGIFTNGGQGISITLNNATIQCQGNAGVIAVVATLNMDNVVAINSSTGLEVIGGTATITNSTFVYNNYGVVIGPDRNGANAVVDFSGGGNTFACSTGYGIWYGPWVGGIDFLDGEEGTINASNCAWSSPAPDYFACRVIREHLSVSSRRRM